MKEDRKLFRAEAKEKVEIGAAAEDRIGAL